MEQQREKDGIDVSIDFFLGAVVGVLVGGSVYFALKQWMPFAFERAFWIFLFGGFAIAGSLSGLLRNRVKKKPKRESLLAPVGEALSTGSKAVLWMIFILGCASFVALRFLGP